MKAGHRAERWKASRLSAAPFRCRLVVMAKLPALGRVKTRLAREIGGVEALRFYRHTLASVAGRLAVDPRWQTLLSVTPDPATSSPVWPKGVVRVGQGRGDLGRRMRRIMELPGPGPVIIVGTDIPAITPERIAAAFRLLRGQTAVIGAAPDGGYWLVGLRRSPRIEQPFANVRWSSPWALADTRRNLAARPIAAAATLNDVDDAASYAACRNWFGRRVLPVEIMAEKRT